MLPDVPFLRIDFSFFLNYNKKKEKERKRKEKKGDRMLIFENLNVEFKQEYVPDIRKEVMGFANAEGGSVFGRSTKGRDSARRCKSG